MKTRFWLVLPLLLLVAAESLAQNQPRCPAPRTRKPGGRLYATAWVMPDAHQTQVLWDTSYAWRAGILAGGGMGWWVNPNVAMQGGISLRRTVMNPDNASSLNYYKGWFAGTPMHLYFYPNLPGKQFKEINSLSVGLIPVFFLPVNAPGERSSGFNSLHVEAAMGFCRKPSPHWEIRCETVVSYPLIVSQFHHNLLVGFRMGVLRRSRTI